MRRRHFETAALVVLATMMVGVPASGQEEGTPTVDFVVSPSRIEAVLAPGDVVEIPIRVYNRGAEPLLLEMYVEDIEISRSELVQSDELAFTASRWTAFTADELVVPAGDRVEANVRLAVPDGTPVGGYHAFAFFQSQMEDEDGVLVAAGRIGATVLLEVAEDGQSFVREARVISTDIEVRWDDWLTPVVESATTAENVGQTHVLVGGLHTYRPFPGADAVDVEVGPQTVLRGTRHTFSSATDAVPMLGRVAFTSELVYQVAPGDLPVILTQATVWVIPWHLIVPIIVLVFIVGPVLLVRRRRGRRSEDPPTTEEPWHEPATLG